MEEDLYKVLQVQRTATQVELKTSYQRLALQCHPDKGCTDGGDQFIRINAAWQVLGDEVTRTDYDKRYARDHAIRAFSERVSSSEFVVSADEDDVIVLRRPCRCGDYYELIPDDLLQQECTIQCTGCSLYVTVTAEASGK